MKVSELIQELIAIVAEDGDVDVQTYDCGGSLKAVRYVKTDSHGVACIDHDPIYW